MEEIRKDAESIKTGRADRIRVHRTNNRARVRRNASCMVLRFAAVFFAFLFLFILKGNIRSFAGSGESGDRAGVKYYSSVLIYPGDSLSTLADEYFSAGYEDREALIKEIAAINHLSCDESLSAGNHVIVPVYRK